MAAFESLGYCPYNEIVQNQCKEWLELSEADRGFRRGLWSMVGTYLVCEQKDSSLAIEPSKIFFETKTLADKVLMALITRYNFNEHKPIWIKRPNTEVADYVLDVASKEPQVIISSYDAGKLVVISNGENDELIVAYWDISPNK